MDEEKQQREYAKITAEELLESARQEARQLILGVEKEKRVYNDLRQLREDFGDHEEDNRRVFAEIHKTLGEISEKLDPVLNVYKAALLSKGFLGGLATVVISITAIGAGVVWIINQAVNNKP